MSTTVQTDFVKQNAEVATAISLFDRWVAKRMHQIQQPGLSVGLVYKDRLIWAKGYGYADLDGQQAATLDTLYRIASISKTFTATAILQLRDAGKLCLDDPLVKYLPWFNLQYPSAPPITIRHVLTHTSGLPRDAVEPLWTEGKTPSWEQVVATTQKREPVMPPVTEFKYSNLAYALLGGVIEAASGQAYADYIRANILDPLEMFDTRVAPQEDETNLATGYLRTDEHQVRKPARFMDIAGFTPAAGLASTINDMAKYAVFHLSTEDNAVLSPHTLRDMHRVHWLYDNWDGGYGLGISVQRIGDWTITGHGGGYTGYLTGFTVCRAHQFGVIVLTNAIDSMPFQFYEQAYKLVLPAVIEAAEEEKPAPDPVWQRYVGTYVSDWSERAVVIRDKQLQVVSLDFINEPPVILLPTDEPHVFKMKAPNEGGETARFEMDDEGAVVRFWIGNEYDVPKK